jgi:putative transposase
MIDREHELPIKRQAELAGISRSSVYYRPKPVDPDDLALMRRIDELHMERPFAGSRMLRDMLNRQRQIDADGVIGEAYAPVCRKRVTRLMKLMDITALYRKPGTSQRHPGHKIFPYLLRDLPVGRANQVYALDTTYIPMREGFVYLTAVIDWASRKVLAHKVAITLEACHAVEVLEEAISKFGVPEMVNTDQGSQFTASAFVDVVLASGAKLSMDGKGAWRDNVFVERLWRSVKYEEVFLHAYETVFDAKAGIRRYIEFYNAERPHSSLNKQTPDEAYAALPRMTASQVRRDDPSALSTQGERLAA